MLYTLNLKSDIEIKGQIKGHDLRKNLVAIELV